MVIAPDDLLRWRPMFARLRRGPSPRGERFELCREILAVAPESDEAREAARQLLEGGMADSVTSIADAQEVMRVLKAATCGELDLADLYRTS